MIHRKVENILNWEAGLDFSRRFQIKSVSKSSYLCVRLCQSHKQTPAKGLLDFWRTISKTNRDTPLSLISFPNSIRIKVANAALTALLELKLKQPIFSTSCQRAIHEYVCQRGRSPNLCKVSSCVTQLIYASTGRECTHTHNIPNYTDEEVNKIQNLQCAAS